ncbi:MAG: pyridoxal-phosphate dependent enzyme [Salinarimonas sp.]
MVGPERPEAKVSTAERESVAADLAGALPGAVLMAQHENAANPSGYDETLAVDLLAQLGPVDAVAGAVGTGGSLCGLARGLRRRGSTARVIGVEPRGSIVFGGSGAPFYQSGTGVPPGVPLGDIVDFSLIDEGCTVSDVAAFNTCRFLARRFALLIGGSAGGVVYAAAERLSRLHGRGLMVAIVGDGGERYLDTVFDDDWMSARGLLSTTVETDLATVLAPVRREESADVAA